MNRNDDEFWVWGGLITLALIAWWVHTKVKEFAEWAALDMDSAYSVLVRIGILLLLVGITLYKGWFSKAWPYLFCGFWICALPALTYWSWNYVLPEIASNSEPSWYGRTWVQMLGIAFLGWIGYAISQWIEENY